MPARSPVHLEFEQREFDAAVDNFLRRLEPKVISIGVRKMAFDVVEWTTGALNGERGLPRRIDTGRLRAGWRVALADGGIPAPSAAEGSSASLPGDGFCTEERGASGDVRGLTVGNRVEYAPDVEYGTEAMRPGMHLEGGLRAIRERIPREHGPGTVPDNMDRAFHGKAPVER